MEKKQLYKQKHGFKTPKNYFEGFEDRLFLQLKDEKLPPEEKIAPGFNVPKGYFQHFEMELPKEKTTKVLPLFRKENLKYVAGIAAMLVFIFTVFTDYKHTNISFDTIGYGSIESYIENDRTNFSEPEIKRILLQNPHFSEVEFDKIDDTAIFDYLIKNSNELSFINQ